MKTLEERFWKFVNKTNNLNECWLWIGGKCGDGYGSAYKMSAHRLSWTIHFGNVPDKMLVCHKCDNRLCVNPNHLFLGTILDNLKDRDSKNRQAKGEQNGRRKLTEENVLFIKKSLLSGRKLGLMFGITKQHANQIKKGYYWKNT